MSKTPLDPDRIAAFTTYAIETHAEASQLKGLLDLGAIPSVEIEGDEMHLYLIHPDREDTLHVAAWPVANVLPAQN